MSIKESELILNPDGSIYHLNLKPEHISNTIIVVGDPDRVARVTQYFDSIEYTIQKREFITQTGTYNGKRITVLSTGIGTDNIDIVFNELDALVNIDLETKAKKSTHTSLDIVRIGTSGSIQKDIPIDAFVISDYAVGFDSLLHFYQSEDVQYPEISNALMAHTNWSKLKSVPYVTRCSQELYDKLSSKRTFKGFTGTNVGFYGPQGRVLRLPIQDPDLNDKMASFNYNGMSITNLEMETSAIYGLASLLGHKALSMNAIIANRANGDFSKDPRQVVNDLILYTLNKLTS